jgi:polyhydroxybutyrate depolymerase
VKKLFNFFSGACLIGFSSIAGGCHQDTIPPPRHFEASMDVNGLRRSYIVSLPPSYYTDTTTYALVIGLHGTGGSASQFEETYGFSRKADEAGFIAIYPNGLAGNGALNIRTWNAGTCCDYASKNNIDDVGFISNLIDKMISGYRIDPKRIYVTGMSNGGMMSYRLAAAIPQKIAAIAPVSSTMVYSPQVTQLRPVPILELHSVLDNIVPYGGGTNQFGYYFPPVDSVLRIWSERNQCLPDMHVIVDDDRYKLVQWVDRNGMPSIIHYLTKDGGHSWPGGQKARPRADPPSLVINANDLIWEFFRQYKL